MPPCCYDHPALDEVPLARALAALADPCRVAIIHTLAETGRELACSEFGLSQSKATISHHFRTLREGGLIRTRAEGTKCLNSLRREEFEARFPGLLELVLGEASASIEAGCMEAVIPNPNQV